MQERDWNGSRQERGSVQCKVECVCMYRLFCDWFVGFWLIGCRFMLCACMCGILTCMWDVVRDYT